LFYTLQKNRKRVYMFLIRVISTMVAILIIAYMFPSIMWVDGVLSALAAAFILGLANGILRPVLIILTLPITLLSMGFFLLIINGLMLGLVAFFVPGFHVNGLLGAVIGSVLVSIVTWILSATVGDK
jgi:putative membrane protein